MRFKPVINQSGSSIVQVLVLFGILALLMFISIGELARHFEQAKVVQSQILRKRFEALFTGSFIKSPSCTPTLSVFQMNPAVKTVHTVGDLIPVFQNLLKDSKWATHYAVDSVELEILPDPVPKRSYYSSLKVSLNNLNKTAPPIKRMDLKFYVLTNTPDVSNKSIIGCQNDEQQGCEQIGGVMQYNPNPVCVRPAKI
ncbi:MAG: hypothetical protein JNM39_15325 [Bdellovibrionaceae bacterium]|nr:hypothetical protein [Pseudobdellovibrionaceae bacterium]